MTILGNDRILEVTEDLEMVDVIPTKTGRYIIPVPKLSEISAFGFPNIKLPKLDTPVTPEILPKLRSEALPEIVPTDGNHSIIINNIDEREAAALDAKYLSLTENNTKPLTLEGLREIMAFAQGVELGNDRKPKLTPNAVGFNGDAFYTSKADINRRYVAADKFDAFKANPKPPSECTDSIDFGHCYKKPYTYKACFFRGEFYKLVEIGGTTTLQHFTEGALIIVPTVEGINKPTAASPEDINSNYMFPDGSPIKRENSNRLDDRLPAHELDKIPGIYSAGFGGRLNLMLCASRQER